MHIFIVGGIIFVGFILLTRFVNNHDDFIGEEHKGIFIFTVTEKNIYKWKIFQLLCFFVSILIFYHLNQSLTTGRFLLENLSDDMQSMNATYRN